MYQQHTSELFRLIHQYFNGCPHAAWKGVYHGPWGEREQPKIVHCLDRYTNLIRHRKNHRPRLNTEIFIEDLKTK